MRTALSAIELTLLRCPIQWQRLYVAVHKPATLFSARLASVPTTWSTGTLAFNNGSPTSGTAPADTTIWIGASAGARDKGVLRLRSALTLAASGTMSVAELGEQAFDLDANDYLTIVEDIRPAAKHIRRASDAWFLDYDIEYLTTGSGNNYLANDEYGPLARIGPPAIGFLNSNNCTLRYVGERSAAYTSGKSISTYAWTFPNTNTSSSQGTTATPILENYTTAIPGGRFHKLIVTESDTGKTHTRFGLTYIFERTGSNAPYDAALLGSLNGGPRQGGYRGTVTIRNTAASQTDFPDEAHVTLFAEDHWKDSHGEYFQYLAPTDTFDVGEVVTGGTSGATGTIYALPATGYIQIATTSGEWSSGELITGADSSAVAELWCAGVGGNYPYRQNIILDGYIVGESITTNPETGQVEFEIATLDEMLRRAEGYPVALTNRSTTPTLSWEDSKNTTANTATHHFIKWRSTIGKIADVEFAGTPVSDNVIIKYVTLDKGALWDQLNSFWNNTIFGWVSSDRQGALYCEMDANIDEDYRGNVVAGHTLTRSSDLRDEWELPRQPIDEVSQWLLLGVAYRKPLGSKSPGDPHLYEGLSQEVTTGIAAPLIAGSLTAPDQTTFNEWCGNLRARSNNPYKNALYRFAGNWRLDVVPQHFMTHSISSGDTKRSLTLTNQRFVPRELRLTYNADASALLADMVLDAETIGIPGVTYTLPTPQEPPLPEIIPEDPPAIDPTYSTEAKVLWLVHSSASSNPPVAVLYEVLDDITAPIWTALIPPASLYIDELYGGYYDPNFDRLMLVGHASQTPPGIGWAGGESKVTVFVDAPLSTSPVWALKGINGQTVIDVPGGFVCNFGFNGFAYADVTLKSNGFMYWAGSALGSNYMAIVLPYGDTPDDPEGCFTYGGRISGGALAISPAGYKAQAGYMVLGSTLTIDQVGPMPDDLDPSPPFGSTYYSNPGAGTTHDYIVPGIEVGAAPGTYLYGARFVRASGAFEFIRISAVWAGFPNGAAATYSVVHTADETAAATRNVYWTNTFTPSEYAIAVLYTDGVGYPYLYLNGSWSKSDVTVNQGFCHFTAKNGSTAVMYVEHRAVSNGSVPAKFTEDISDVAGNAFVELTGNMWSGGNKIMQSGGLDIRHSFLTF